MCRPWPKYRIAMASISRNKEGSVSLTPVEMMSMKDYANPCRTTWRWKMLPIRMGHSSKCPKRLNAREEVSVKNELPVPPGRAIDKDARELVRAWADHKGLSGRAGA